MVCKQLSLDVSKTRLIVLSRLEALLDRMCDTKLQMSNQTIDLVQHIHFLGVELDANLSGSNHISVIASRLQCHWSPL